MKKILLLSFILLFSFNLISQEKKLSLGFSGGTTFSSIKVENYLAGDYGSSLGLGGELFCVINLNPHVFIMTNVGVLQRGYDYNHETPVTTVNAEMENSYFGIEFKTNHYYLNNDWLVGYQFGNAISVSISGGIFYSYYLSSKLYDRNYVYFDPIEHELIGDPALPIGYSENEMISKGRDQKVSDWDLGIAGCISLGYMINEKFTFHISGKYHHSLYDISEMRILEEVNIYNRSILTYIGIKVRI